MHTSQTRSKTGIRLMPLWVACTLLGKGPEDFQSHCPLGSGHMDHLAAKGTAGHFQLLGKWELPASCCFWINEQRGLGEVLWAEVITLWCLDSLGTHSVNRCALAQPPYGEQFQSPHLFLLQSWNSYSSQGPPDCPPRSPQPAAKESCDCCQVNRQEWGHFW